MPNNLMALSYFGGKAGNGKADWVNSLLPLPNNRQLYVEPYGGMAAVLLIRQRAANEILNDINGHIMNWWECLRDYPQEFARLVRYTPISRTLYNRSISDMDDESLPPIKRALAFHIIITQGLRRADYRCEAGWRLNLQGNARYTEWTDARISALANRMSRVQLECKPAVDVLRYTAPYDNACIYVDPPYPTSAKGSYLHSDIDIDELTDALMAQEGFVAVNGYGDEWEHLGWHRFTKAALRYNITTPCEPRTEVLWTNKPPPSRLF